ncbi:nucleotidyltransferase substrate binding protein [Thiolapillus sp.]
MPDNNQDIRWQQRLGNYEKALAQLEEAVKLSQQRPLSNLEKQGLIQGFEFTHELAWKLLKDFFVYQGNTSITGSRDATREAFKNGLIENGDTWMEMIASRNKSSHTYNQATADEITDKIIGQYFDLFKLLQAKMHSLTNNDA